MKPTSRFILFLGCLILFSNISNAATIFNVYPADTAKNITKPIPLSWSADTISDFYAYNVIVKDSLNKVVYETTYVYNSTNISIPINGVKLKSYTTYYWQVISSYSPYDSSKITSFTTGNLTPMSPLLTSPDSTSGLQTVTPVLNWYETDPSVTGFRIQVSDNSSFSPVVWDTIIGNIYNFPVPPDQLKPNSTYYWRAAAISDTIYSPFAPRYMFTTNNGHLDLPYDISPTNDSALNLNQSSFISWTIDMNPINYRIYIATDTAFKTIIDSSLINGNLTGYQLNVLKYNLNTNYYWELKMHGPYNDTITPRYSFTTGNVGLTPNIPYLLTPYYSSNVPVKTTFIWEHTSFTTSYNLIVFTATDTVVNKTVTDTTYTLTIDSLHYNTYYNWNVRAINKWDTSAYYYYPNSFTTEFNPASPPLKPLITSIYPYVFGNYNYEIFFQSQEATKSLLIITEDSENGKKIVSDTLLPQSDYSGLAYFYSYVVFKYSHKYVISINAYNKNGWSGAIDSIYTSQALTTGPVILYPANGITVKGTTPVLKWDSIQTITAYNLSVSLNSYFDGTILDSTIYTNSCNLPAGLLSLNNVYYWRVAAIVVDTFQLYYSGTASFIPDTTGKSPSVPVITSTITFDTISTPNFSWSNDSNVTYSVFVLSKSIKFNTLLYADTTYGIQTTYFSGNQYETLLTSGTWTYYRLTTYNDFGDSLKVDSFYYLKIIPQLISPPDKAIVPMDSVVLITSVDNRLLTDYTGMFYSYLQVSSNALFNAPSSYPIYYNNYSGDLKSDIIDSTWALTIPPDSLKPNTTYWWRVYYTANYSDSVYSSTRSFFVDTSGLIPSFTDTITGINHDSVLFTNTSYEPAGTVWYWNFGDGSASNAQNPVHYYAANGNYNVCLTIKDPKGKTESVCQTISLGNINTSADFVYTVTSNDSVIFSDLSAGNIASWYWAFGDGSYASVQNPNHVFAQGTYNVCLSVKDSLNNISQYCTNVNVNDSNCVAAFNYFINENDSVYFADNSGGKVTRWFWNIGNGTTSALQNTWLQLKPGEYNVMLSVSGPGNCLSSQTRTVIVGVDSCQGTVDFDYFVNSQIDTVSFVSTAKGWNSGKYFWSFGDGSVSILQNPVHEYSSGGIQLVTLTVSDSIGNCIRTTQKDVQLGNVTCSASFTYFADSTTVSFNNASIGTATSLNWFFGDGGQSTQLNPVHTYPSPGYYSVDLYTYNRKNQCMDYSQQNILAGALGTDCQAGFTYFSDLTKDSSIYFSNQSVGPKLSNYTWNFGDSKTSSMQNPSHHYSDSGYFNVCLTISNKSAKCYNSNCQIIKVGNTDQDCYIKYIYTIDSTSTPHKVIFEDKSFGTPISWQWYFGSDDSSHSQNPSFNYSANGYYPAKLIATTQSGCRGEYLQLISINEDSLKAVFMVKGQGSINLLKINEGPYSQSLSNLEDNRMKSVSLSGTAYGDPTEFLWDFGDGSFDSTTLCPTHTYADTGSYEVCLTIWEPQTNEESQYCNLLKIDSVGANSIKSNPVETISINSYPDPISSYMNIQYSLTADTKVDISIVDQLGRKVATIVSSNQSSGTYSISWQNTGLDNGVYYLKLSTDNASIVNRIMVINNTK